MGTRTQREIEGVLARGGVVGGSSAGATIQGSYLVRGAREGNQIMMAKGYEEGFGYLRGVAIDQHLLPRGRQDDLVEVIKAKPDLLGIGLDEPTAIVVKGDRLRVVGRTVVGIYDGKDHDGKPYYFLSTGEQFDLRARRRVTGDFGLPIDAAATTAPRPAGPTPRSVPSTAKADGRRVHPVACRYARGRWPGRSGNGPRSATRRSGRRRCWRTPWRRAASGSSGASRGSRRRSSPRSGRASR